MWPHIANTQRLAPYQAILANARNSVERNFRVGAESLEVSGEYTQRNSLHRYLLTSLPQRASGLSAAQRGQKCV